MSRKFSNLGGGDTSVDANPQKDPNDYLAPIAGNNWSILLYIILIIIAYKYFCK